MAAWTIVIHATIDEHRKRKKPENQCCQRPAYSVSIPYTNIISVKE